MQRLHLQNEMNEMMKIVPLRKRDTSEGLQMAALENTGRSELTSLEHVDDQDEPIVMHTSMIDQDTPGHSSRHATSPIKGWHTSA